METELTSIVDKVAPLKTGHQTDPRKAKNWLSPEAVDAKKRRRRLERRWKASNAEPDRLAYRAACSSANKLITTSFAASNLERVNEASKNPKRLWTTIKSILLSPPISQSLANSLASFFYQKIVSFKDSIALKLQGSPTPFDFDLPHSGEVLSDFTPVTPAEVSQLLRSMSNKSSPLDYIPTSLLKSCADTFSILISHLANLSFTQATFPIQIQTGTYLSHRCWKNLVYQSQISQISDQYQIWIPLAKSLSVLPFHVFFLTFQNLPVFLLYNLLIVNFILLRLFSLSSQMISWKPCIDSGKITILTALDMSAAFDTLDHITLLHRLQHTFGLSGYVISWIRSYLTDRSYPL